MNCLICQKPIAPKQTRTYVTVKAAATSRPRKVYACEHCQEAFDAWIDSRAVDEDGTLFDFQAAVTTPAPAPAEALESAADLTGWDKDSQLAVCIDFIGSGGEAISDAFAAYVKERADADIAATAIR